MAEDEEALLIATEGAANAEPGSSADGCGAAALAATASRTNSLKLPGQMAAPLEDLSDPRAAIDAAFAGTAQRTKPAWALRRGRAVTPPHPADPDLAVAVEAEPCQHAQVKQEQAQQQAAQD